MLQLNFKNKYFKAFAKCPQHKNSKFFLLHLSIKLLLLL